MYINPFSTAIAHAAAAKTSNQSSSNPTDTKNDPQNMFIQLLTAQLQNQTPLDPVDPTQFTNQLVQFNMLDQLAQINQTLQTALGSPSAKTGYSSVFNSIQGAH